MKWRYWVPATIAIPFFVIIVRHRSRQLRTPAASTATGFSAKMFLPASIAALMCVARKPGGVARIT